MVPLRLVPRDRALLVRALGGAVLAAAFSVAVLAAGRYVDFSPPGALFPAFVVTASFAGAAAVGWCEDGLALAWLVAGVVVLPVAWVLALGGPPELDPSLLDVARVALRLAVPYSLLVGSVAFAVGAGCRRLLDSGRWDSG